MGPLGAGRAGSCLALGLIFALLAAAGASAAAPEELLKVPPDGAGGASAGRIDLPRDIAADPRTGHVYVSDRNNDRISEFTAWGEFIKAWGWNVAPGAVDEEQEVRVRASEGQFRLGFEGDETPDLAHDAGAAEVEAALEALPAIASGGGGVTVSGGTGTHLRIYVVRFDAGPLAGGDVAQLSAADGTAPLGGVAEAGVSATTRANGAAAGVGPETCTTTSGCQEGIGGNEPGQFNAPKGVAVDASSGVYVFENLLDGSSFRLQKFSSAGEFLWMAGGGVNQGGGTPANPGNLCTAQHLENGDTCGAGASGTGDGEFSNLFAVNNYVAYNPVADTIVVGDKDRIQEFNPDGSFAGKVSFAAINAVSPQFPAAGTIKALAVDGAGNTYVSLQGVSPADSERVFKLSPSTAPPVEVTDVLAVKTPEEKGINPLALETDVEDNVYVVRDRFGPSNEALGYEVLGFDSSGACIVGLCPGEGFAAKGPSAQLLGLGTNLCAGSEAPGNLYVATFGGGSYFTGYGTPPIGCEPPPVRAPDITAQYAVSAGTTGASVQARINPHFWPDTRFHVQYGTEPCSAGGCTAEQPAPPGVLLTGKSVEATLTGAKVPLAGLQPDTTYHFRFVAASGGGETVGGEASFKTFAPEATEPCANDAFRAGPSAKLPDCRAYELVSDLAKGSADITAPNITAQTQSSTSGERFTYSSATAFADPEGGPAVSQYLTERREGDRVVEAGDTDDGWQSEAIAPPRTRPVTNSLEVKLDNEFKAFSADLCSAWLRPVFDPALTADAVPGYLNLYRRDNCAGGDYEALTTEKPRQEQVALSGYIGLELQGLSAGAKRAIFVSNGQLTDDAPPRSVECTTKGDACNPQLYERDEAGELHYVCILPNGEPVDPDVHSCFAGTAREVVGGGREGSFQNAISADGERIFWSVGPLSTGLQPAVGPGPIYVRIREEDKTLLVSAASDSRYWTAADDGGEAIFTSGGNLFSFDVDAALAEEAGATDQIASGVVGVLGASQDASRVYFASTVAIPASGQNSEKEEAEPGEPNLYLWERGPDSYAFVGTLSNEDLVDLSSDVSPLALEPLKRISRVSDDGLHALFNTTAPLKTDYDNTDAVEDRPASEVYLYDAAEAELRCVSCNPSGARPTGSELVSARGAGQKIWAAAQIPPAERALHASRVLSADGRRAFFESYEALVLRDTNGLQDVYQWEEAGAGSCDAGDPTFNEDSGGCVELISSGESPRESNFLDASPSGDDVFFSSLSSLVPPDFGLIDVYDARVDGGFRYPEPEPPCEGEACQSPPAPPPVITPSSAAVTGEGNAKPEGKPKPCGKGKRRVTRKGKARCVKKKQAGKRKARKRRGSGNGRAGR